MVVLTQTYVFAPSFIPGTYTPKMTAITANLCPRQSISKMLMKYAYFELPMLRCLIASPQDSCVLIDGLTKVPVTV